MKLSAEVDGESYGLELARNGGTVAYTLSGAAAAAGTAGITEITPGVFSVLLGSRSFQVRVERTGDSFEVWTGADRHTVSIADARDRPIRSKKSGASGPVELRAQMPGKVINLLVQLGAAVEAGQGLVVVEAMKMQNEMKSPKDGIVSKIHATEGSTVAAGEALLVVE
ncbi:MAG TPA: biotin/lipoyl-containing protein [Bryobacteraceae bacterium]|nr:biotin/lipoyl-containing protein [Bryobacteraceae bacterium]